MEPSRVPPIHPLKRAVLHLDTITPSPGMAQPLFVGAVHVFS